MSRYDTPDYQVVEKDGIFEIRKYDTFYTSSVKENDLRGYSGFGLLFSYISGDNVKNEKMAMTIPVINTFDEHLSMEFVIPKDKMNEIPKPTNDKLAIKRYEEHFAAVIKFSGSTGEANVKNQLHKLQNWITKKNLVIVGPFQLARYNPPFSIPFLRKNEIMITITYQA
jgi:hypothetical protein